MEVNLYDILGVDKNATASDIKASFKKLSRTYHPDRQAGKSDTEKKEAEERFKEINHAYEVLSDPEKRSNYDQFGSENPQHGFGGFHGFPGFDMFQGFGGFPGFNPFENQRRPTRTVERGKDIQIKVKISVEDLFTGTTKKIKYNRLVRCINCHGTGGSGIKICPDCSGSGFKMEQKHLAPGSFSITQVPCKRCNGTGQIVEHKCPTCNGDGLIKESTTVDINIEMGVHHNTAIRIAGYGADTKTKGGIPGDLIAVVQYDFLDNDNYEVFAKDNKIYVAEHIYIPYYDMLLGCSCDINLPSGELYHLYINPCTPEGTVKEIIQGNANYNVILHYKYPEKLSDIEKEHIQYIKANS